MKIIKLIFVVGNSLLARVTCREEMMFQKTSNMTVSSWNSFKTKSLKMKSAIACASHCLYEKHRCNAWHYNKENKNCQIGKVRFIDSRSYTYVLQQERKA